MYQELELVREIDILSVDSNDNENDGDICSIFGGNEANNLIETRKMIDFKEAYENLKWICKTMGLRGLGPWSWSHWSLYEAFLCL